MPVAFVLVILALAAAIDAPARLAQQADDRPTSIRATFYDLGYPEGWRTRSARRDTPTLGRYRSTARATIHAHLQALETAGFDAAFAGYDGRATKTRRLRAVLDATAKGERELRWAAHIKAEAAGNPSPQRVADLLNSVGREVAGHPAYLQFGGRPVVVIEVSSRDTCRTVEKWVRVNNDWSHLLVEGVRRAARCRVQPPGWFAGPSTGRLTRAPGAVTATPPLGRRQSDISRFRATIRSLNASRARWKVLASFNDWRSGRAIESAVRWRSITGYGALLDAVRDPSTAPTAPSGAAAALAAAGDIACNPTDSDFNDGQGAGDQCRQAATAQLAAGADAVVALGDIQYEDGTLAQFRGSFDRSWGQLRGMLRPVVGNHEYHVAGAAGYFDYFNGEGVQEGPAGTRAKGWYAYDVGEWSVLALNTNCDEVDCKSGSEQISWLRERLAAHPRACTVAMMHQPRFSSGKHGNDGRLELLWKVLADAGVELVLAGHDHHYERFAPQDAQGNADAARGIRSFVVGTGGHSLRPTGTPRANSRVRLSDAFGVLRLELGSGQYRWRFIDIGGAIRDQGSGRCR